MFACIQGHDSVYSLKLWIMGLSVWSCFSSPVAFMTDAKQRVLKALGEVIFSSVAVGLDRLISDVLRGVAKNSK